MVSLVKSCPRLQSRIVNNSPVSPSIACGPSSAPTNPILKVRFFRILGYYYPSVWIKEVLMEPDRTRISLACDLLRDFAQQTGLSPAVAHPRRYLWTDAFAVCIFLELCRRTNVAACREHALRLVGQVHQELGRYRDDDPREGWISGLPEAEAKEHPTRGGLRIGKSLPERGPQEAPDEREWDRDGQYYHYLTKWMHALSRVSRATGDPRYLIWAKELAKVAHARFTYTPSSGGRKRMYWKMSTDLTRPLVPSMGQHDPLDGYLTYLELQTLDTAEFGGKGPDLSSEIIEMAAVCREMHLVTEDPLGIGGLLSDAVRLGQLGVKSGRDVSGLLESVLDASLLGMDSFTRSGTLRLPAEYRLAFRELGLSIGLRGMKGLQEDMRRNPQPFAGGDMLPGLVQDLGHLGFLADQIEQFWLKPGNRMSGTWTAHQEINTVMLATSLVPDGFLGI
jgi:hypothetical protein